MKIKCRYCKNEKVVKYGFRKNKKGKTQIYMCKSCKKIFSENTTFSKMKHKGLIITTALDLYFKNVSLRRIQDHLKQVHNVNVTHVTILNWIRKYSKLIKEYTDKLKIDNSDTIHADEMMVNINGKWTWIWNVMDRKTKFITSSRLSKARYLSDAKGVFKETNMKSKNKLKTIVTDGLPAYRKAIRKTFWRYPRAKHMRLVKFWDKINNNPIERFQGTVREMTKTRRGFGEFNSTRSLLGGFIAYYNFIRPHMSLNGLTPAQASGIDLGLDGGNRWNELIKLAVNFQNNGHSLEDTKDIIITRDKDSNKFYIVRVFKDGIEIEDPKRKLGTKTEFKDYNRAKEFVEFYKQVYPEYKFEINSN
ncbi:MAG: IS6 family transposase [Candidatus Aenigmatarchaeota archaeon]